MPKKRFSEQLREAIERSDKTRYRISQETDILQSTLSRFMRGECGLGMGAIDKLCECLGVRLTNSKKRK